jgi:hypothetical protein
MTKYLITLFSMFMLVACSDDKSTAALEQDWSAHCDDYAMRCPNNSQEAASCKADFACLSNVLRADLLPKMIECNTARTCEQSDDACFDLATQGLSPSAAAVKFKDDCLAKKSICDAAGGDTISNDRCTGAAVLKDDVLTPFAACLSSACADLKPCLRQAEAAAAPGCD